MLDLEEQLCRYGEAVESDLLLRPRPEATVASRRWRSRKALLATAAVVVVAAIGGFVLVVRDRSPRNPVVSTDRGRSSRPGMFSTATNTVLLFSDGIDGVTAIDLDHRRAARRVVDGERAGDQQFRLTLTEGHLVVGWGEIYSAPLAGGTSTKIADATIYVPAAEPGEVWTLTWAGGRIGAGDAVLERVRLDGTQVFRSTTFDPNALSPITGVPGGLLVNTNRGVAVWNADTGTTGPRLGPGPAEAATSNGRIVAWCVASCSEVYGAKLERTGPPTAPSVQAGSQRIALSPNGSDLAVLRLCDAASTTSSPSVGDCQPASPGSSDGVTSELVMMTASGTDPHVVARGLDAYPALTWSKDGSQLFVTTNSYQQKAAAFGRYDLTTARWEMTILPVSDLQASIALDPGQAQSFFSGSLGPAEDCPGPNGYYPSGRKGTCAFEFR